MSADGEVERYERDLARRLDTGDVVTTSSGTTALQTALYAAGIGPGDEVLVPALAVVMAAAPVLALGAHPVVVDTTPDGTGFDLADLHRRLGPRTRAVLPVLMWGRADSHAARLGRFAHDHGLAVVVDACQALGTTVADGRQAGLPATAVCFSTHTTKILSTGEGGFLATDDPDLAARARAYRSHWLPPPPGEAPLARPAHNFRLAAPLAAIGRGRLAHLDALVAHRRSQTALLTDLLAGVAHLAPTPADDGWNGYAPLFHLTLPRPRAFCEHLADHGVPNSTGTFRLVALDERPTYRRDGQTPCRNAAAVLGTTLAVALPSPETTDAGALAEPAGHALVRRHAATILREITRWAA